MLLYWTYMDAYDLILARSGTEISVTALISWRNLHEIQTNGVYGETHGFLAGRLILDKIQRFCTKSSWSILRPRAKKFSGGDIELGSHIRLQQNVTNRFWRASQIWICDTPDQSCTSGDRKIVATEDCHEYNHIIPKPRIVSCDRVRLAMTTSLGMFLVGEACYFNWWRLSALIESAVEWIWLNHVPAWYTDLGSSSDLNQLGTMT